MATVSSTVSSLTVFNWKLFFILLGASVIAGILVLPYSLSAQEQTLAEAGGVSLPRPLMVLVQILQMAVISVITIGAGLFLANKIGIRLPVFEAWTRGTPLPANMGKLLRLSMAAGLVSGAFIIIADVAWLAPAMSEKLTALGIALPENANPPAWQGFLASFYGGITEEILTRLFLLTLFAWLGHFISQRADGSPTLLILWAATTLAAVVFGLGHLPTMAAMGIPLEGIVVIRSILLNLVPGMLFGWLYWQYGLSFAIFAHFTADIVIHVIAPLFIKGS